MEITGLGLSFFGALILGINAYASSDILWTPHLMREKIKAKLREPIIPIVGLGIMTIGFGLQFVAELLS